MVLRVPAPRTGTATAILLHGLGDSGAGLKFLADETHKKPGLQHINFVLPTAPTRHFPAFGQATTGWFDLKAFGVPMDQAIADLKGVEESLSYVNFLIEEEIARGIPANRILVGGFSQGAGLTQATAFTGTHKLAGFAAMSGMLPMAQVITAKKRDTNLSTPVFLGHGTIDDVVPVEELDKSAAAFKDAGFTDVETHKYRGLAHSLSPEELADLFAFFERTLS